jgi:hypothetical protein
VTSFKHDVFISYGRADVAWAREVDRAIRRAPAKHRMFFDVNSLRAGDDWEGEIQDALESSRHLVVLWSDQAKQSDWVTRELWTFMSTAKPKVNTDRRVVVVNLQGMNQATKGFQQISRMDVQGAYPKLSALPAAAWQSIQQEIEDGLDPARRPLAVPLVVLTATLGDLQNLPGASGKSLVADFGLTLADLAARYKATREDWSPFGGAKPIGLILKELQEAVNGALGQYRLEWKQPDDSFWTDILAARSFVSQEFKTGQLAVLVIDPVAMYIPDLYQRLMLFHDCLANEKITIVALPPFAAPNELVSLRHALVSRTMPYFDDYFDPRVPPARKVLAQCGWNAMDGEDVRRLLVAAAGRLSITAGDVTSPFVRQG